MSDGNDGGGGYRDDHLALRQRTAQLEGELDRAHTEIRRLRGEELAPRHEPATSRVLGASIRFHRSHEVPHDVVQREEAALEGAFQAILDVIAVAPPERGIASRVRVDAPPADHDDERAERRNERRS